MAVEKIQAEDLYKWVQTLRPPSELTFEAERREIDASLTAYEGLDYSGSEFCDTETIDMVDLEGNHYEEVWHIWKVMVSRQDESAQDFTWASLYVSAVHLQRDGVAQEWLRWREVRPTQRPRILTTWHEVN